jgi:hypothetical protein
MSILSQIQENVHAWPGWAIFSLVLLGLWMILIIIHDSVEQSSIRKQSLELDKAVAERIRQALNSSSSMPSWIVPDALASLPFYEFVELLPNAEIRVGGQRFRPDMVFRISAIDKRNIPRATVTCGGDGIVHIASHGQFFCARFGLNQWEVRPEDTQGA